VSIRKEPGSGWIAAPVSRRAVLRHAVTGAGLLAAPSVFAQVLPASTGVEWRERFDLSPNATQAARGTVPMLSAQSVASIEDAIRQYEGIVANGGWPRVAGGENARLGSVSASIVQLRARLAATGDLEPGTAGRADTFDSFVDQGLRRFQYRHGLPVDGVMRRDTLAALNVTADQRLQQLRLNVPRLRAMATNLGDRHVVMNIPAAELEAVQNGQVSSRHTTVVGKIDRQSPVLSVRILEVNFNPFWTVPTSIVRRDLIPRMQRDPDYLAKHRIRIFDGRGQELSPNMINWQTMEAVQFRFRQDPNDLNSMGSVRIGMPNSEAVYMHDTPDKSLFGENERFHSSGCARVQNVRELVTWILADNPEWPRARIDQAVRTDERVDVRLRRPIPVYWVYVTAWVGDEGMVQFRPDVYQRDQQHLAGDMRLPATPFDSVGPQAFAPGMRQPVRVQ
jgi:L,D-transpeptidase YcbB